ncbi:MAG: galactosylceramidase, partial [Tepidisphaeraceae bacterium]
FDNPGRPRMWDWLKTFKTDPALEQAVGVLGNHTLTLQPPAPEVEALSARLGKPIWNTEEHPYNGEGREYKDEFDTALGVVNLFNDNFISHGATKVVNWYLVGSTYGIEPYADQPPAMIARSPWSGAYRIKPELWSYAHYGQFTQIGWKYLPGGCRSLSQGGTVVALASGSGDYSVIVETRGAKGPQTITVEAGGALSSHPLCVWRTTRSAQFERQADITPVGGRWSITLEPDAIYSVSTTTGQQKGSFDDVPADKPFPMPYADDFESYGDGRAYGYLPAFTADICGVFEIAERPDHHGHCLRQVVSQKAQSWAPEWMPYTILGDATWQDYSVTASIDLDGGGWAGLMGRVTQTGNGWEGNPSGYYARLYPDGGCSLYVAGRQFKGSHDKQLAIGDVKGWKWNRWHTATLTFAGPTITLMVDGQAVLTTQDTTYDHGLAGLITGGEGSARNTACFDDLQIKPISTDTNAPATAPQPLAVHAPLYRP